MEFLLRVFSYGFWLGFLDEFSALDFKVWLLAGVSNWIFCFEISVMPPGRGFLNRCSVFGFH